MKKVNQTTIIVNKRPFKSYGDINHKTQMVFHAMIKACGAKLIFQDDFADHGQNYKQNFFLRDPMVVVPQLKKALHCGFNSQNRMSEQTSRNIRKILEKYDGYKVQDIGFQIDGGDIIYHPAGFLLYKLHEHYKYDPNAYHYIEAIRKELQDFFKIPVMSIYPEIGDEYNGYSLGHLDYYIGVLPNGTMVIPVNWQPEHNIRFQLSKSGIYPEFIYHNDASCMNFLTITDTNSIIMDDPELGSWHNSQGRRIDIRKHIADIGYKVRSLSCLVDDSSITGESYIDHEFQKKVFAELSANPISQGLANEDAIHELLDSSTKDFWIGDGGPRCMTQEVEIATSRLRIRQIKLSQSMR